MATPSLFDLASAQRIAAAVRKVEVGDRSEEALRFRRELPQQQRKVFRIATFSGSWNPNTEKVVQISATGQTVNALNRTFPLFSVPNNIQVACSIARDGTAWHLVDVGKNNTFPHLFADQFVTQTVIADIQIAATLNTSDCSITVTKTPVTATVTIALSTYTASFLSLAGMNS